MELLEPSDLLVEGPYGAGDIVDARYRLVRPLGEGGMGVVWVAHDQVLEVHVAMKLVALRHKGTRQETLAARLLQEARAAARLGHPAICRVLNFGTTQFGDPYIASELLDGEPLSEVMERVRRMSAVDAIRTLLPIVDALASAHSRGIVHRDVKPDNVFLAKGDHGRAQPKLLDFGIARVVDSTSKITMEGSLLGTPDYMSPEQARGHTNTDGRTDVWSVTVVLYEMMTGVVPFAGENYNAVLWSVMNEEPRPTTSEGAGDAALWKLLERGLEKDPDARWQSMRDLGVEFAKWLFERGVQDDICGASLRSTWIEASFSGDRPSMVSPLPSRPPTGPPTLPGDGSERPLARTGSARPRSRGTGSLPPDIAANGLFATSTTGHGTDSRVSFSSPPAATRTLAGLGGTRGLLIAGAAALVLGIGGTVLVMASRKDTEASATQPDQVTEEGAPAAASVEPAQAPTVTPVTGPATVEPDRPAASASAEPPATKKKTVPPAPRATKPKAAAKEQPEPPKPPKPPPKKSDDYTLGF